MIWTAVAVALAPGDFDPSFDTDGKVLTQVGEAGAVQYSDLMALAVQPDGKIVGGGESSGSTDGRALVVRFNGDGSFDSSFGTGGRFAQQLGAAGAAFSFVNAVAVQPDGKILLGGVADGGAGENQFVVARLNPNGALDSSFGSGGVVRTQLGGGGSPRSQVLALALAPDGKILAGGRASDSNGDYAFLVARLNGDGSFDSSFASGGKVLQQLGEDSGPTSQVNTLALQPDGKVVAGGYADASDGNGRFMVVRLNGDGGFDSSFGSGGKVLTQLESGTNASSRVRDLALQPDGKIVTAGDVSDGTSGRFTVARLNGDGSFDSSFDTDGKVIVQLGANSGSFSGATALVLQPNGKVLAGGDARDGSGRAQFLVARLNADGAFDSTFGAGGKVIQQLGATSAPYTNVYALALQPDGKVVAGGAVEDPNGNDQVLAARLITDLPPTAAFSVSADPVAGKPVAFDGSASSDPGGAIGAYRWDFGDGATATGAKPTHVYRASGRYTVTLTVADDDALTGATAKTLSVAVLPALSKLKVSPRTFVAAGGGASIARRRRAGTTVTYRDSHAATTTFTVRRAKAGVRKGGRCVKRPRRSTRRRKRCTRFVAVGRFAHKDRAGKNRFRFTGRVRRHKLAPGRYRLEAVPRFAGRSGPKAAKGFHVVRRRAASKK